MPKRIKDYGTAATTIAADDYFAIDGVTNGTRKALLPSIGATGLLFGAGTAGAPLMAVGTAGNGVYAPSGNTLGFSTNGLDRWKIDSFGTLVSDVQSTPVLRFQPSLPGTTCGVEWFDTGVVLAAYAKYNVTSPQLEINAGKSGSTGRIVFYTNTTDVGRFTSAGSLLVGTNSEIGLTGAGGFRVASTTSAASSVAGAVVIGDLTAATTVAIGGGKVNVGTSVVSPLVVGGTATTQDLTLQTTSGIGASGADMHFLVGNNGATEAMTILNSGFVGIMTASPVNILDVNTLNTGLNVGNTAAIFGNDVGTVQSRDSWIKMRASAGTSDFSWAFGPDQAQNFNFNYLGARATLPTSGTYILTIKGTGFVGINTTAPGKALEINSATGANLRLTYNDSDGSAVNYADFSMSSGGNLTIAPSGGALSVTGSISASTYTAGSVQSLTGAGAVNVTTAITEVTTTGAAQALTLANGAAGQEKTIIHGVDGGSFVLTPTTKTGWSTFTATAAGESITLVFLTTRGWIVKGSYLGTIAP